MTEILTSPINQEGSHRLESYATALPGNDDTSPSGRLSLIDRFLPLWIFAAMALGVLLGRVFPDLGDALDRVKVAGVSLPIAIGLLWMMYPVLAKVQYEALAGSRRRGSCSGISLLLNWLIGPLLMFGLAWAFLPDVPALPQRPDPDRLRPLHRDGADLEPRSPAATARLRPCSSRSTPSSRS